MHERLEELELELQAHKERVERVRLKVLNQRERLEQLQRRGSSVFESQSTLRALELTLEAYERQEAAMCGEADAFVRDLTRRPPLWIERRK